MLRVLLPMGDSLSDIYLLLQEEAAVRVATAPPGSSGWRATSVLARYYSTPSLLLRVPAAAFHPAPRVDSALVRFALTPPGERNPAAADPRLLHSLVGAAFAQRRKKMRNSLAPLLGGPDAAAAVLEAAGVRADERADAADVAAFVGIANAAADARAAGAGVVVDEGAWAEGEE